MCAISDLPLLKALFDTIPVSPMKGKDIVDWNKLIWTVQSVIVLIHYMI
jgi:hypothetical protein